jgi:fatty acid desaturase
MKELHPIKWYVDRISPELPKEVFKPVPTRLIGGLVHLIILSLGIIFIGIFNLPLYFKLIISLIVGCSFASLGFLAHEILHGTVVRKPWIRNLLGAIAFWPLSLGPKLWIKWHNMTHHAHTQDEDQDPDAWLTLDQFSESKFLKWIYKLPFAFRAIFNLLSLCLMFTIHSTRMFLDITKKLKGKRKVLSWFQLFLSWSPWIILLFILGVVNWIFAYLIPMMIGNFIVMSYISTNHRLNPLVDVNDPLANSLSVTVPRWVDALHFNFSYHTEHHLYPAVNPKYYPLIKQHIKKLWPDRYHEMPLLRAMKTLFLTPRVYYDKTELMDPHKKRLYGSLGNGLDPQNISFRKLKK